MKILIIGGNGFVGTALIPWLSQQGHRVTVVDRKGKKPDHLPDGVDYVGADTTQEGRWQQEVQGHDAVVNLAGATIFRRWNRRAKERIFNSRILTTKNLVQAMVPGSEMVLINASAAGYYGPRYEGSVTESDPPGHDFLARVCIHWEREALLAEAKGIRVVLCRFGIVLGRNGGALPLMARPFLLGFGGPLGDGLQWMPWIHMEDLVRAVDFVLQDQEIHGPVNFCAPQAVRNRDFASTLGRIMNRPAFFRVPGWLLRSIMGEFGSVLLQGQRVFPSVLLSRGFVFHYPSLESALCDLILD